jgi:hypothetical protein
VSFSSGKGKLKNRWLFVVLGGLVISTGIARASTIITNTRAEVAEMAGWWEVDSVPPVHKHMGVYVPKRLDVV